ncbi:ATP-binding protein [Phormidium sp. CCY1219]|uniref:ATP-binding protein n=1 Tax=Phormidium sp. CCY1219 TaxID=2886104 RepID=UPI002D1F9809|nr:ATP-binding protein [Phormidium sp. CCY1219]MEB3826280.1 PAS domain S-box protein [Phormidium sp. CCY1219]
MASQSRVKKYLADWLQLGQTVWLDNGAIAKTPKSIICGNSYSTEFQQLWQTLRSPTSGICYLQGTEQTIAELLTPRWEILDCARCSMPIPLPTAGMSPMTCPCHDLPHWPNMQLPTPRSPIGDRATLKGICNSIDTMVYPAELSALSTDMERSEYAPSEPTLDRIRPQSELILNSVGEGICGLNKQGKITFINRAAEKMLGYESKEAIGQSLQTFLFPSVTDTNVCPYLNHLIDATLDGGVVHYVTDQEFSRKNGTCFPVEYFITPMRQKGEIVGAVLTFKDISDRLALERMKDEFVSVVSHELRTPLTSIRGALKLLSSGLLTAEPDKSQRMLEIAVDNTDRLLRLLNDILDIQRITFDKTTIVKQTCNAADLMNHAAETMQGMAAKTQIKIAVEPLNLSLWADSDRLQQVFTNLLSNAIKFSPAGSTVWLTASLQDSAILFQVIDKGRGIPAEKLETIFERFQQVDPDDARTYGGTGLGLAICQQIVQQHGGRIWVESKVSEGSTFSFTLPLFPVAQIAG